MSDVGYSGVANYANTQLGAALNTVASNALPSVGVGGATMTVAPNYVRDALSILRRPTLETHVYLPGIGAISGLTAGNYILSDGSTGEAAVDGPVGLVLDGMGSVGANVITNGDFTGGATGWSTGAQTVISGGSAVVTASASAQPFVYQPALTSGVMYLVTFTVNSVSGGSIYSFVGSAATGPGISVAGSYFAYTVAAGNSNAGIACGVGVTASVTNIKFMPVTGIHATSTGAARPTVRRGAFNQFTYSQDATSWTKTALTNGVSIAAPDGSITGQRLTETAVTSAHWVRELASKPATANTYTASVYLKAGERTRADLALNDGSGYGYSLRVDLSAGSILSGPTAWGAGWSSPSAAVVSVGNGWYRYSITATSNTATFAELRVYASDGIAAFEGTYLGDIAKGIYVWGAQLETGSTASAYSPTTTAAASNATAGQYSGEFAGAQSLTLGSVPFQYTDDHAVITAGLANGVQQGFAAPLTISNTLRYASLSCANGSVISAEWYDGTQYVPLATPYVLGTSIVASAMRRGSSLMLRTNGIERGSGAAFTTAVSSSGAVALIGQSALGWLNGGESIVIFIKGTLSDADMLCLERFVASLTPGAPVF